jgi:Holliday junction resolvase
MASTKERLVKQKVVAILKSHGAYYFYPITGGYGASGVPDIVVCYKGRFIGIECKAGNNKPTALQEANLTKISEAGGFTLTINEENVHAVIILLHSI